MSPGRARAERVLTRCAADATCVQGEHEQIIFLDGGAVHNADCVEFRLKLTNLQPTHFLCGTQDTPTAASCRHHHVRDHITATLEDSHVSSKV